MKRVLFTILVLCGLCLGLQAQNTNTTDNKGVTSQGQLDTVRNTRVQNGPIQSNFVDQFGKTGQRPGLSPYGQRLNAIIKVTSSSMVSNSVSATTATIAATVSDSGDYALPIIERGVCYATTANPTLLTATKVADATISGKGFGNFNVSLSGLQPNTAYHARAYAVSLYDTVYGEDLTFTTLKKNITPALSLTGWTYGAPANTTPTLTGNEGNGEVTYQYKLTSAADNTYATFDATHYPTAAGNYTLKATIAANGYYNAGETTTTFSIAKATLTATAANTSRSYGSNNPTFTVNVTSFVNGETAATAAGYTAPTASTTANSSSNVGDYAITPSGGSATNYNFSYVNGTLTINKVAATLSLNNTTDVSFTSSQNTNATNTSHTATYSGGTLTASSSDANKASVSVNTSTGVITVTRKTAAAFSNVTITVSVTPDGNHTAPSNKTFNVSATLYDAGVALANSSVGYKVCSNGKAYATNATLPSGVSVIGMVAYKNGSQGIVLYKQDNSSNYTWDNRNNNNPSAVNVYVSNLSSTTNKSWTCGTKSQYEDCGVNGSSAWSTLQSRLSSAECNNISSTFYWSSTEPNDHNGAYFFQSGNWSLKGKDFKRNVRPLFAF